MAKRFIDTDMFKDPFVRGLDAPLKTLWVYIFCDCDNAGLWTVEVDIACMRLGISVSQEEAVNAFKDKIVILDDGFTWFLPSFIKIQYNDELRGNNKAHTKAIAKLNKYGLLVSSEEETFTLKKNENKGLPRGFQAHKVEVEVEDMVVVVEKDEEGVVELWPTFEDFWDLYDFKNDKNGCEKKWGKLKHEDKLDIMEHLRLYIPSTGKDRNGRLTMRRYPATYLNKETWKNEIEANGKEYGDNQVAELAHDLGLGEEIPGQST